MKMRPKYERLSENELLALAYAGFIIYWLFLLISWPPLQGFIQRVFGSVL